MKYLKIAFGSHAGWLGLWQSHGVVCNGCPAKMGGMRKSDLR